MARAVKNQKVTTNYITRELQDIEKWGAKDIKITSTNEVKESNDLIKDIMVYLESHNITKINIKILK